MRRNLRLMYAIALLQGMVFYGPIATLYRQARGVDMFQIALIEGLSLALEVLLEVPWGLAAERIGYRRTMIACSGLYFASKIVFWRAAGFFGFLLERILLSAALSGLSGVDSSIVYLSCEGKGSQRAFGVYGGMSMAGLLIAAAVFALLPPDDGALAALLTAASYGAALILSFGITEVRRPEAGARRAAADFAEALRATLGRPRLLLFLLASALLVQTHQTVTVFLNQLQYERCGMTSSAIGLVYIAATALGLLSARSAALCRRTGVRRALALLCALPAAACAALALTRLAAPSVAAVLALRISNALFQPLQEELQNRQIHTRNRATALSVHSMFVSCAAIATNLAFGALSERSLPLAFGFGALLCALALPLFALWRGAQD